MNSVKTALIIIMVSVLGMFVQRIYNPDFIPLTALLIAIGLLIIDVLGDILEELRKKQLNSSDLPLLTKKETALLTILNKYPKGIQMKEPVFQYG